MLILDLRGRKAAQREDEQQGRVSDLRMQALSHFRLFPAQFRGEMRGDSGAVFECRPLGGDGRTAGRENGCVTSLGGRGADQTRSGFQMNKAVWDRTYSLLQRAGEGV